MTSSTLDTELLALGSEFSTYYAAESKSGDTHDPDGSAALELVKHISDIRAKMISSGHVTAAEAIDASPPSPTLVPTTPAAPPAPLKLLKSGHSLLVDESIESADGRFRLVLYKTGFARLYVFEYPSLKWKHIWSTWRDFRPNYPTHHLRMGTGGLLVLYSRYNNRFRRNYWAPHHPISGRPWSAASIPGAILLITNDGAIRLRYELRPTPVDLWRLQGHTSMQKVEQAEKSGIAPNVPTIVLPTGGLNLPPPNAKEIKNDSAQQVNVTDQNQFVELKPSRSLPINVPGALALEVVTYSESGTPVYSGDAGTASSSSRPKNYPAGPGTILVSNLPGGGFLLS